MEKIKTLTFPLFLFRFTILDVYISILCTFPFLSGHDLLFIDHRFNLIFKNFSAV